MLKLSCCFPQP